MHGFVSALLELLQQHDGGDDEESKTTTTASWRGAQASTAAKPFESDDETINVLVIHRIVSIAMGVASQNGPNSKANALAVIAAVSGYGICSSNGNSDSCL